MIIDLFSLLYAFELVPILCTLCLIVSRFRMKGTKVEFYKALAITSDLYYFYNLVALVSHSCFKHI
jgi:hypothetical protein